jgi:hypothetical protein
MEIHSLVGSQSGSRNLDKEHGKKVVQDTVEFEYTYHYDDVFSILELLSDSPRVLVEDETYASDGYFRKMVGPHYSPLEKRLIADENDEREGAES